jgi:hypothetical protein
MDNSLALKAHKILDIALDVKTEGEYFGEWKFKEQKSLFERQRKEPSVKKFHSEKIINESFCLNDIAKIEQLSNTKNISGLTKASIAGAVIAGPVGALAAGAFVAAKNSIFVEVTLSNQKLLHCHMSQVVFEKALMSVRTRDPQTGYAGIQTKISGEKDNTPLVNGLTIAIIIFMALSFIVNFVNSSPSSFL